MEDRVICLLALGGACLAAWIASAMVSRPVFASLAAGRDVHPRGHAQPIGRGGGVAVAVPVLLAAGICGWPGGFAPPAVGLAMAATLAISFLVGLVDDVRPLGPLAKFIGQCIAAAVLATGLAWSDAAWPMVLAAVLLSLWSQNAWNFIDGSDGLMAVAGVAVFSVGGGLAWHVAAEPGQLVLISGLLVAGLLGFLPWNLPSARLFLGDAGSLFVGGAYALCTVLAFRSEPALGWAWVVLASPVHADVLVCLVRRVSRGCRWWEGHREHAYQHLMSRHGSHGTALALGGTLWVAVAVPASIWAIHGGGVIAAAAGIFVCSIAVAALGSGRPMASVVAAVSKPDLSQAIEVSAPRRRPVPSPAGLAMTRPLAEVARAGASGATFATSPLRK